MVPLPPLYITKDELKSFNEFFQNLRPKDQEALQQAIAIHGQKILEAAQGYMPLQTWLVSIIIRQQSEIAQLQAGPKPAAARRNELDELVSAIRVELRRVYGDANASNYVIYRQGARFDVAAPVFKNGQWERGKTLKSLQKKDMLAWLRELQEIQT